MPKPVAETRARVNAHARETDTQFMEQLEFQAAHNQAAWGGLGQMTVLTMRYLRGHFVVTGPDIEPLKFKSC